MDAPHLDDACQSGEHELVRKRSGIYVCKYCGLDSGTISNWLGHR